MQQFHLEPDMLTMRGVFYPTGYMFLMFPTAEDARAAGQKLRDGGNSGDAIYTLTPAQIREELGKTISDGDEPLPSAGTESDTVRRYCVLADLGHHALMIHAPKATESDRVMELLADAKISYGQKYRHLVIEDLVEYPTETGISPMEGSAERV